MSCLSQNTVSLSPNEEIDNYFRGLGFEWDPDFCLYVLRLGNPETPYIRVVYICVHSNNWDNRYPKGPVNYFDYSILELPGVRPQPGHMVTLFKRVALNFQQLMEIHQMAQEKYL